MTVGQLKERLALMDDNLKVYLYNELDEGGADVRSATLMNGGEESFPYCNGDKPEGIGEEFVLISG